MNNTDSLTRRRFLRATAAGGIAYAFARTPGIAYAQMAGDDSFAEYKALVCIFLLGGNDSWNMLVPSATPTYRGTRARARISPCRESRCYR